MKQCTIDDCPYPRQYKLYCSGHHKRNKKWGNPLIAPRLNARAIPNIPNYRIPGYSSWKSMKLRCLDPTQPEYKFYGGRGVTICDRWRGVGGFRNFMQDMGPKPTPKHTLDRKDPNGNYEPSNCEWATKRQQTVNKRKRKYVAFIKQDSGYTIQVWKHRCLVYWRDCKDTIHVLGTICSADYRYITPTTNTNNTREVIAPYGQF